MFLFSLARELGMTVREVVAKVSAHELAEWKAFFKQENDRLEERRTMGKPKAGKPEKVKSPLTAMRGMFGHLVKKKDGTNG